MRFSWRLATRMNEARAVCACEARACVREAIIAVNDCNEDCGAFVVGGCRMAATADCHSSLVLQPAKECDSDTACFTSFASWLLFQ